MFKGFRQLVVLTIVSRVLGMCRDMAFAFFFGATGLMDGWVIAFMIPNLARRLFGEGAASSSLIPIYSRQLEIDRKSADVLASTTFTVVFVILACIVLVGEAVIWGWYSFFSPLPATAMKLSLSGLMLPYMILICLVAITAGLLNAHKHFAMPAVAPLILNIFIIGSLFFSGWVLSMKPQSQLYFVACIVLVAGIVQLAVQFIPLRMHGVLIRPSWQVKTEEFQKMILLMAPMIFGLTVTQINTLADVSIAAWFSGSAQKGAAFGWFGREIQYPMWEGAVSQLFYSQRLYQFPLGVLGISLATAIFPVMSSDAAKNNIDALCNTIAKGIKGAMFVALPATAGLILVRQPLVSLIFERGKFSSADTTSTAFILTFYSIGLAGFFMQQICTRAFYSLHESKKPAQSAFIAVVINVVLNLILIWPLGAAGLALSTAFCSYLQVVILLKSLAGKLGRKIFDGVVVEFIKTLIITLVMFAVSLFVMNSAHSLPRIVQLAAAVVTAVILYTIGAVLLKAEMLSLVTGRKLLK
ncbi:MAG: murein biosynthesis integral membrane protein MurJ [Sedimentisphaerales bacterium]|nr:murein biosynthesis integral membrane protein MurJ [Sedimentisphaerales bacterium]